MQQTLFKVFYSRFSLQPSFAVVAMATLNQLNSNIFLVVSVNYSPLAEIPHCIIVHT